MNEFEKNGIIIFFRWEEILEFINAALSIKKGHIHIRSETFQTTWSAQHELRNRSDSNGAQTDNP